jgi:hypothetical protein
MTYVHNGWKLHTRDFDAKGGNTFTIYFFAKKKPNSGTPCDIPDGWRVLESKKSGSGMPYLKKK